VLVANEQLGVPTGNLYFDVRPTIDGIPIEDDTAVLASGTVPISILPLRPMSVLISFDVASFGVPVAVGDVLAVVLRSDPGTDVGWYGLLGNPYPLGVPFGRGGSSEWQRDDFLDLGFQTFVEPIPKPCAILVSIDIKPGSDTNPINPKSKGVIPVAILTTNTFDATTVDPLSVQFGPDGATEAHGRGHIEDANGDGRLDLVLHFNTKETGIQCGDTSASLTGKTFNGQAIEGSDSIKTVGCK
jgi:hypothetical protein